MEQWRNALLCHRPQRSWVREELDYNDANWHVLVKPPTHRDSIVVTDLIVGTYQTASQFYVYFAYYLNGVAHEVIPISFNYEGKHFPFETHWVLPVNSWLICRRVNGNQQFGVSALGYFIEEESPMRVIHRSWPAWSP